MAFLTPKPSLKQRLVDTILRFLGLDEIKDDLKWTKDDLAWLDHDLISLDGEVHDLGRLEDRLFDVELDLSERIDGLAQDVAEHLFAEYWDGADMLYGGFDETVRSEDFLPDHGTMPELPGAVAHDFAETLGLNLPQPQAAEPLEEAPAASKQTEFDLDDCWGC